MVYGIGVDLVELDRIQASGVDRLAKRILSTKELEFLPEHPKRKREYVAGRFAAKEAVAKALKTGIGGKLKFTQVEIIPGERGEPMVYLSPTVQVDHFGSRKTRIHLSLSHSETYALAMAVIEILE